ncbi:MAG TPA: putative Ig domain-containing protein [Marmoricola sp.]|jgi:hypothetical protein|nr:putative Ig domain-containing protein [Marmoricola sp.]
MGSPTKKHWSAIAILAGLLLVLAGLVGPAEAATRTSRSVTLTASPRSATVSSAITFSGKVTKSAKGAVIEIEREVGSQWTIVAYAQTTSSAGAYSAKANLPGTAATYSFRALAPQTTHLRAAVSATTTVTATVRPASATLTATPASIGTGATTTLAGAVTPFVTGTLIEIERQVGANWVVAGTTALTSSGTFSLGLQPSATTTYRALIPKTTSTAAAISPSRTVTVIAADAPTITTTTLPQADKGIAYSTTLAKTGGAGTWSVNTGSTLPAGLSLSTAGILSGTPTAGGTTNFTVKFTETATSLSATKALTLVVTPPPTITTASLPDATQGVPYSTTLSATGNPGTWSLQAPLPAGLSLDASTGVISGTTTVAAATYGVYPVYTETASGRAVAKPLPLNVVAGSVTPPNGPTITTTTLPQADKGIAYSTTLAKTGADGTWSVNTGSTLPAGLSLSTAGVLSGTPTAGGTVNFTVKFTETASGLSDTQALSLVITPSPTISTTTLPDATQGVAYSTTLAKTGGAGTWTALNLPAGLSINAATGEISGTTTIDAGTYGVFPTFTETSTGRTASAALSLTVDAGTVIPPTSPSITTTTLPTGSKGVAYSTTLVASGTAGTWSVAGNLPPGITLSSSMGVLSGTPTAGGSYGFTITYTQTADGAKATKGLAIYVNPAPTITTTSPLPDAHEGLPYSVTLTKAGDDGTWSLAKNKDGVEAPLPAGLTLNPTTGEISGTPTTSGDQGVYVVFTETDTGVAVAGSFLLHIIAPQITTTSVPDGLTGTAYSQQLAATGLAGTWTQSKGVLPDGITLSSAGLLAGTATETGDFGFTATYTETATGISDNQAFLLHISAPGSPTITTDSVLPDATVGTPYSTTLAATPTGGTWSIVYASLPVGLTLNPTTGVISGTPAVPDNELFIAKYTKGSTSNTRVFALNAQAAPTGP